VFFLHVSLVPFLAPSGELKTKPTQHSVAALRNIGIQPDALILRADREVPDGLKRKISLMCDVDYDGVVSTPDAPSIYDIPKVLHREGLDAYVVRRLGLPFRDVDWTVWGDLLRRVHEPQEEVRIAVVGKYVDLPDAYLSVTEAVRAGGFANRAKVEIVWVASDVCETDSGAAAALSDVDGVLVPGGFGVRGIEGKLGAIRFARTRGVPLLGLCLGLQCLVIEAARNLAGLDDANSSEFDPETPYPVISTMADQTEVVAGQADMGASMRLGAYPAVLEAGSVVAKAYGTTEVSERHRHRFEVNNSFRQQLTAAGLHFSGTSPDGALVEFVELPAEVHPFFVATQAHPELKSRPTRPHPLFAAFIRAAIDYEAAGRLPVEITRPEPVAETL
ncbi:MAG: CTP synthase, partial [Mycobacteriaceae bacterium]